MNDGQFSNHGAEQLPCRQQIVAIFLRSAKRKLVSLELRANLLRTGAIRKAAHLAAGTDVCIIDACFRHRLHYDAADEYADNIAKVIAEITQ
jgi:hypothetical protein